MGYNDLVNSIAISTGQHQRNMGTGVGKVIMKPAYVVNAVDAQDMGRITARVVEVDQNGNIIGKKSDLSEKTTGWGGMDKDLTDDQLPLCYPLMPRFLHSRPKKGEMVMIFFTNPDDPSSPRHYLGPIITTDLNINIQTFEKAYTMYNVSSFTSNPKRSNDGSKAAVFTIDDSDIAIKGRNDADLILKNREAILTCARYTTDDQSVPNLSTFSYLKLQQFKKSADNVSALQKNNPNNTILAEHSISETNSTVLCMYSPRGKFRGADIKGFETNPDIPSFTTYDTNSSGANLADTLHPAAFGDENIKVLDLIIRVLLNHIHTPQNPLLREAVSNQLAAYTVDGLLQNITSNHVRIN